MATKRKNMKKLIDNQKSLSEIIKRSANEISDEGNTWKEAYIRTKKDIVTSYWETFVKNHFTILEQLEGEAENYIQDKIYEETEAIYIIAVAALREHLPEDTPGSSRTQSRTGKTTAIKLPNISIPQFSGNYKSWRTFHDLFSTLVHENEDLSEVQKLHYLKTSVTGEAAQVLKHFAITNENYLPAWQTLIKRFENKRVLINAQLQALMVQPIIKFETAYAIKELKYKTEEVIHELNALHIDVKSWDVMLVYMIQNKLPQSTIDLWESSLGGSTDVPSFEKMLNFLETRFRTLEALENNQSTKRSLPLIENKYKKVRNDKFIPKKKIYKSDSYHNMYKCSNNKCAFCEKDHMIQNCGQFKKLNPRLRIKYLCEKGACLNCLKRGHNKNECILNKNLKCLYCRDNHNTEHCLVQKYRKSTGTGFQTCSRGGFS